MANNPLVLVSNSTKQKSIWIDCIKDAETAISLIEQQNERILEAKYFEGFSPPDLDDLHSILSYARFVEQNGEAGGIFLRYYYPYCSTEQFPEVYLGYYRNIRRFILSDAFKPSFKEFEKQFPTFAKCIDWEAVEDSVEDSKEYRCFNSAKGGIHIFRNY